MMAIRLRARQACIWLFTPALVSSRASEEEAIGTSNETLPQQVTGSGKRAADGALCRMIARATTISASRSPLQAGPRRQTRTAAGSAPRFPMPQSHHRLAMAPQLRSARGLAHRMSGRPGKRCRSRQPDLKGWLSAARTFSLIDEKNSGGHH